MKKLERKTPTRKARVSPELQKNQGKSKSKVKSNPTVCHFPGPGGLPLTAADLESLRPGEWLTDQVVALEVSRLEENKSLGEMKIFDSVFYQKLFATQELGKEKRLYNRVVNMLKSFNHTEHSLLLFPCCNNLHWFLIVADMFSDTIYVLDSLNTKGAREGAKDIKIVLEEDLKQRLGEDKVMKIEVLEVPQQKNGSDCGLFCIGFITNIIQKGQASFLEAVTGDTWVSGDITSWLELEGASRKRREIIKYIQTKSEQQGLQDWDIRRDGSRRKKTETLTKERVMTRRF